MSMLLKLNLKCATREVVEVSTYFESHNLALLIAFASSGLTFLTVQRGLISKGELPSCLRT